MPRADVARIAADTFGWDELRPGQQNAMEAVVSGRDVLLVMPTGSGKSAVYQVPAVARPGPTVVVSPLLALQQDQLESLEGVGESAVRVSSAESATVRADNLDAAEDGAVEFVFVTPEQLADPAVVDRLRNARPSLVAVDEAHCVSVWGHDFRPDYLQVGRAIQALGRPPVVALTATAAPPVRDDIVRRLGLEDPLVVIRDLDRPNITLEVRTPLDDEQRMRAIVERVGGEDQPGIVYTATRRSTEELAERLVQQGIHAVAYHAGLRRADRDEAHASFMGGEVPVMVATSAFGMGIDKPDVRFVLHAACPDSPDSYLQEFGRAGRDGAPARAVLYARPQDLGLRRFLSAGLPKTDDLRRLASRVCEANEPLGRDELRAQVDLGPQKLGRALNLLEQVGVLRRDRTGRISALPSAPAPPDAAEAALEEAKRQQRVERSRLEMMRGYVETRGCRRQFLLGYLGDVIDKPCGACDTCWDGSATDVARRSAESAAADGAEAYPVSSTVAHVQWGDGTVMAHEDDAVVVLFHEVGYKTLSRPLVEARGLLRLVREPAS